MASTPTIEQMLTRHFNETWAAFTLSDCAYQAQAAPTDPEQMRERAAEARRLVAEFDYVQHLARTVDGLAAKRKEEALATFAGSWPPSEPLSLAIQWAALLDDIDELPAEYLGADPFAEDSPMFSAWLELDSALKVVDPKTPKGAAAILFAAKRDEEMAGGTWSWEEQVLETATAHAPSHFPRAR